MKNNYKKINILNNEKKKINNQNIFLIFNNFSFYYQLILIFYLKNLYTS